MVIKLPRFNKTCGSGCRPLMIAEEGQANDGDHDLALRMIDKAALAGADGIEFQLGRASELYVPTDPMYAVYKRREFSREQIAALAERAHRQGMFFQAACLTPSLVPVCAEAGADSFCVNAMDIDNPYMLEAVSATDKPFWIATLMSTLADVDWAVEFVRKCGAKSFGLLHGQHIMTSYHGESMPPEVIQLDCINLFEQRYQVPVGYVDHTDRIETPALAVMRGASLVMKHLAPERDWRGPDWTVCLTPDDWKKARELVDLGFRMLGAVKEVGVLEAADQPLHRRSLWYARELKSGMVIGKGDVISLRPGGGMSPKNAAIIIGSVLARDVCAFDRVNPSDIKGNA